VIGYRRPRFLGERPALRLPFEVEREEWDDGDPELVSLRSEVHADECCTPRELNALEAHTFFLLKFGLALADIGWVLCPVGLRCPRGTARAVLLSDGVVLGLRR
jgi:hypothetical protein